MKIVDAIDLMSKTYLERVAKSFMEDAYKKNDEEGYKDQIKSNIDYLSRWETISSSLSEHVTDSRHPNQERLLIEFVFRTLLGSNEYMAGEDDIVECVQEMERDVVEKSRKKENFRHIDKEHFNLFRILLEASLEDSIITEDELHLIGVVRKKLNLQTMDQHLIQATLNAFPQAGNEVHSSAQIRTALNDLQKCGVLFYCNKHQKKVIVLPEELTAGVKRYLGIELIPDKFAELLDVLKIEELKDVLETMNLRVSGKKSELIERILITGVKPSEVLDNLYTHRLQEICKDLPDVKSSGSKQDRIDRIIAYYDDLVNIDGNIEENPAKTYYNFFEQLARKDMQNLLGRNVIKHERDAELAFERATQYLFEEKLGHDVLDQPGSEHSDGALNFGRNGDVMLWDNKSIMEGTYTFPNNHLRQFKKYIRDSNTVRGQRVSCFLIIVPDVNDSAKQNAMKLKFESGTDTDIAIITAENLKWVAEEWVTRGAGKPLNLEVFNSTGILTRDDLKLKMKMFK